MLEIEKRGFLTEEKYNWLLDFLGKNGKDLGIDDKDVVYYIYPDKLLKVVNNLSKQNAKVALKMSKIGEGSAFPETEVFFDQKDFEKMKYILDIVAKPEKVMGGIQKRKNFEYKGCEFAIKWSEAWAFHFEIEKMVSEQSEVKKAEKELHNVTDELGIKILTDEELKEFAKKAEKNSITEAKSFLGKIIEVKIDRAKGTKHPKHDFYYDSNYGFVPNTLSPDGEELDAYVLGVDEAIENFKGKCVAIIHRTNDNDDKLVVIPAEMEDISDEEIRKQTNFQEQYFKSEIIR